MASLYGIPQGIFITEVSSGSPAEEAGLKKGDIITKFDGTEVSSMSDLKSLLAYYAAGEDVTLVISKANDGEYEESKVDITLGAAADYQNQQ
jgi:serine protease Do